MPDAWNMTYREFTLLVGVKDKSIGISKSQNTYDDRKLSGLENHLRSIGVEL